MRTGFAVSLLLAAALPRVLGAQWSAAPEVGIMTFSGSARDSAARLDLGPTRATPFGIRIARSGARYAIALRFRYGASGLAASNGDVTVVQEHTFRLYEVGAVASRRLISFGAGSAVWLEAGPAAGVWKAKTGERRTRLGASGGLAALVPIGGRTSASLHVEGGVSASVLDPADLPAGVRRRATWRRGVSLSVRRSW
jgi:hypothetical protein